MDYSLKYFRKEISKCIFQNLERCHSKKKTQKIILISEANKMINQNSTATIDNLDEAYIASLMDQLVWAPFPTDSESESERNNFCRFFLKNLPTY